MRRAPSRRRTGCPSRTLLCAAAGLGLLALALLVVVRAGQPRPVTLGSLHWIIGQDNLSRLEAASPRFAGEILAGPQTIVVRTSPGGQLPVRGVPMDLFTSYEEFQRQLRLAAIPPQVRVVAYDPESWDATPPQERHDPLRYLELFARSARQHGYRPVLAPGRDLTLSRTGKCARLPGERIGEAYVRCGIPATAALASAFVIQAAPVELDLPALHRLVEASARQARSANPSVVVLATLSTAPGRVPADPDAIARAARTMLPYVQGFMLNMTRTTTHQGVAFLRALSTGQG